MNAQEDDGARPQWWLDPAIAQLAFGASAHARATGLPGFDNERVELDLDDPEQRRLGEFELLELIGEGGMGLVYRARQTHLQREVAVKLLSSGPWASPGYVAQFQQEARHAAKLQHASIVTIYEMGELEGLVYYAMQLVRGESLAQHLQDEGGKLSGFRAAALMRVVAEAVDYAHSLGVLHLDLKPANILLDEEGQPRVADFGLSRFMGPDANLDNLQTAGTPSYMAPEQGVAGGAPLSRATDVWGLGAILYELLCGQPPFDAADATSTLLLLREGVVRRPSRFGRMSPDLEAICLKCLARSPAERYPTARDVADDLGRFLERRPVSVRPLNAAQRMGRWSKREPKLAGALAMAFLALSIGLGTALVQSRQAERNALTANQRLWESRREVAVRLEQEGKGWEALPQLLQNASEQEQAGLGDAARLDRLRIGVLLGQGATLIDTIAIPDINPLAVALSPDGSVLAIAGNDQGVRWYDTATLTERGRISLQGRISSGGQSRSIVLLRFIDNDRLRATMEWYGNLVRPSDADTWLLDLARGMVIEPPAGIADFSDANYSDDGRHALLRGHDGHVQLWQVTPWLPLSRPVLTGPRGLDLQHWMLAPGGRRAAALGAGMRSLHLVDLPQLGDRQAMSFPGKAAISAWSSSHDGHLLALGDLDGRVYLVDHRTGQQRLLPASRGREVTSLAFSDDDAWLAAASNDGTAHVFDVDSGDSLVRGSMQHDFPIRRIGIDRAQRLLLVSGEGGIALWRIPATTGPRALPAIRIGASPAMHASSGPYAIDWSLQAGLLASAGLDGQVRIWRLPPSPTLTATPPPQFVDTLRLDGRRVVDVAWNRLRTLSVDGTRPSPWLALAQPPGYAELVGGGRTLVVTVGPQLRVYDATSQRLRFAPVALPDTPQRLLVSPDARRVLLSFGTRYESGFGDRLRTYDLATGRRLPGEVILPGPLIAMAFSGNGSRLLAVGPGADATRVLASAGLRVIRDHPHDPGEPVIAADFSSDGRSVFLVTRMEDARDGEDALLVWDPAADTVVRHPTGRARPYSVVALQRGAFVAADEHHMVYDGTRLKVIPRSRSALDTAAGAMVASRDRRLLAMASLHSVQLHTADGTPVGAPLQVDLPPADGITAIAFSDDGTTLLARSVWRWMHWAISPELRTDPQYRSLLERLDLGSQSTSALHKPSAGERAVLRAHDPGAWPKQESRPAPDIAGRGSADQSPIPARAPGTPATLLDLTAVYTVGPESVRNSYDNIRPFLRPFPAGLQRFGGTDFDLRGMLEVTRDGMECVPTPDGLPVAAVHALLLPVVRTPESRPRLLAELVLRYRDGGHARVPIRTTREVPGYGGHDQAVPWVFSPMVPGTVAIKAQTVAAPRLPNPQPGRLVRCVELRTTDAPMLVLGLTLEPVHRADERRSSPAAIALYGGQRPDP